VRNRLERSSLGFSPSGARVAVAAEIDGFTFVWQLP
jgi:hypothetical protein